MCATRCVALCIHPVKLHYCFSLLSTFFFFVFFFFFFVPFCIFREIFLPYRYGATLFFLLYFSTRYCGTRPVQRKKMNYCPSMRMSCFFAFRFHSFNSCVQHFKVQNITYLFLFFFLTIYVIY